MKRIKEYSACECGALTLYLESGESYSVAKNRRKELLPGLDLRRVRRLQESWCCDHCVNHYGLDLCACGSGMRTEECENGFPECGKPMQVFGGRTHVVAKGAWLIPERSVTRC